MLLIVILGIYSPSQITIQQTQHVLAPHSQVWQLITDAEKTSMWFEHIKSVTSVKDNDISNNLQFRYHLKSHDYLDLNIKKFKLNDSLLFELSGHKNNPMIHNYNIEVKLKPLRDGTTEINCKINYDINSFTAKIVNRIYFESSQKEMLDNTLYALKKYLEKV